MTTIFCSQKLEKFLGKVGAITSDEREAPLGHWNGHSFHVGRKRCLIFLNSRTCYCLLMTGVTKQKIGDIRTSFRERLIRQVNNDFQLGESSEINIRQHLADTKICQTNNDRNIIGTMNQFVNSIPHFTNQFGAVENWDELKMSHLLNETPVGAKVSANKKKSGYFFPNEAMAELVKAL